MKRALIHCVLARLDRPAVSLALVAAALFAEQACTPATPEDMLATASVMGTMAAPSPMTNSVAGPTGISPTPTPEPGVPASTAASVVEPSAPEPAATEPGVRASEPTMTASGGAGPGEMAVGGTDARGPAASGGTADVGGPPAAGGSTGGSAVAPAKGGAPDALGGAGSDESGGGAMIPEGVAGAPPEVLGCDWDNPDGRIVLFDGTNLDQWRNLRTGGAAQWKLIGDGSMEVVPLEPPTDIQTVTTFDDLCVHVEYMTPEYPSSVTGQDRGNSGVYLKRAYEMQILDSIGQPPAINTCGAVYSIQAPLVVACHEELVWNTYEIEFKSSVWDANGSKVENAVFVEATLNGQIVQQDVQLNPAGGFTQAGQPDAPGPQPLMLQDHRNLVRFRNIWVKVPHYQ